MDISTLNWLAIIVATVAAFALGGLWYSPVLFGARWMKENNFTDDQLKNRNMAKIFGLSFVWTFVMAFNLAMFLNDVKTDAAWGATAGFLAGFGWIAMAVFILGLFEKKRMVLMLINAGYMVVTLVLMGLIIGAWR